MYRTKARVFKKSIDPEEARRKREEWTVELRKNKREEAMLRRRFKTDETPSMSSVDEKAQDMRRSLQELPALVAAINSSDGQQQYDAAQKFRRLLSIERNPPIQRVIDCGVVSRLVMFLTSDNPNLQFEAAWALTNIASGTTNHTKHVIDHGGVQIFVQLLSSQAANVREQAVWALGNIAGDSHQYRDLVLRSGAMQPLLNLCVEGAKITMLRNATWTISNFCRGKPQPAFELVCPALPTLAQLIFHHDDEVLIDACWALSYLSDDNGPGNQKIQAVIQNGVCRKLIEHLSHPNSSVQTPALRTVGNIVTGDDAQTQIIVTGGALPALLALLINPKKGIRKEACWTISNITAGNVTQIQSVIDAELFPRLVQILNEAEFEVKKEAAWAISNATSGGRDEQIRYLVDQNVLPPLCNLFVEDDAKIVLVALEGVENILRVGKKDQEEHGASHNVYASIVEECRGLDHLESLQRHHNEEVYEKACKIITDYFDGEEDEVDMGGNFSFGNMDPSSMMGGMGGGSGMGGGMGMGGFNFGS
jgi:hypothetical protein